MWTMGDDFNYQYAESWFRNMDRLIHYVNKVCWLIDLDCQNASWLVEALKFWCIPFCYSFLGIPLTLIFFLKGKPYIYIYCQENAKLAFQYIEKIKIVFTSLKAGKHNTQLWNLVHIPIGGQENCIYYKDMHNIYELWVMPLCSCIVTGLQDCISFRKRRTYITNSYSSCKKNLNIYWTH